MTSQQLRHDPHPTADAYVNDQRPECDWMCRLSKRWDWYHGGRVSSWTRKDARGTLHHEMALIRGDGRVLSEVNSFVVDSEWPHEHRGSIVAGQFVGVTDDGYQYQ